MKIITWNINGIRASRKKNFNQYIEEQKPDIICIQESKAQKSILKEEDFNIKGYNLFWTEAKKAGYSGVAIWVKDSLQILSHQLNINISKFDDEGRTIILETNDFYIINSYYPNGRDDLSRVDFKLEYSYHILEIAKKLNQNKPVILTGDFNTAHTEIDLARPKANINNTGFLPIERKFLDDLKKEGFIDAYRSIHPDTKDVYSYWSYRGGAKDKNVGWRIDYFWISNSLLKNIQSIEHSINERSSDHCPIVLNLMV